jgi:membrane protease YdiL (CAAX protease family)
MRKVFSYLLDYYREQHKGHFLLVMLFTGIAVMLNYKYDIENGIIDIHYGTWKHAAGYFLLYACAMIPVYLSYAYDADARKNMLSKPGFWARVLFSLAIFSVYCYFYQYREWLRPFTDFYTYHFWKTCADQIVQALLMFVVIFVFWWWNDRKEQPLYGFKLKMVDTKPYLWMLAFMVPLVVISSFSSSFTDYYPTARRLIPLPEDLTPGILYVAIYELCYGSEFFHIEFFFRGFLILAFVKYAGHRAILPAAVFYCFVHFGKPMGECVSSFFGGLVLGILSYRTGSIAAGVLVHVGIAWLMEAVAAFWLIKAPGFILNYNY